MKARARDEKDNLVRSEYENLALSYLRLADQADRNAENDVVYSTQPPGSPAARPPAVAQQQQQPQHPQTSEDDSPSGDKG